MEYHTITETNPVMPPDADLKNAAGGSYLLGNRPGVDWDAFYDILETQSGYDMQDLGGRVDERIRRKVRKWIREGDVE